MCLGLMAIAGCSPVSASASVAVGVADGVLTVQGGSKSDHVTVGCTPDGFIIVNGVAPATGAITCSAVSEVDALTGTGNDFVNLSGVGTLAGFGQRSLAGGFGFGTGAGAALGPGNDRYVGGNSAFNLTLGGPGDDRMLGGALRDAIDGGDGRDRLAGRAGADVLRGQGTLTDSTAEQPPTCVKEGRNATPSRRARGATTLATHVGVLGLAAEAAAGAAAAATALPDTAPAFHLDLMSTVKVGVATGLASFRARSPLLAATPTDSTATTTASVVRAEV
jgi:Ca2+-binding RTX toxin-like protein